MLDVIVSEEATPFSFRMYTNYSHFIGSAEVRIFETGQSLEAEPLAVVPVDGRGLATWTPPTDWFDAPVSELAYVVRAYGDDGRFDETRPQPLWLVYEDLDPSDNRDSDEYGEFVDDPALLASYGENGLSLHNIGLSSGTVSVRGSDVPAGHDVYVAGRQVPVDTSGNFVTEEILPAGQHTVEVALEAERDHHGVSGRGLERGAAALLAVGAALRGRRDTEPPRLELQPVVEVTRESRKPLAIGYSIM